MGTCKQPQKGTPQGGVASPLLANLFLHYAFDEWMKREYPDIPFERYADDAVCHCKSEAQAERLKQALNVRMKDVGLELHPEKTKIVYCQDDDRQGKYPNTVLIFWAIRFAPDGQRIVGVSTLSTSVQRSAIKQLRLFGAHHEGGAGQSVATRA